MKKEVSYHRLLEISKDLGVPVKKLVDTLFVLKDGGPIDNNELLRRIGVSRNILNKVKERLSDLLEPVSSTTGLSREGLNATQEILDHEHKIEEKVWEIFEDKDYNKVLDLLHRYNNKRPVPNRGYDQFTAIPETVALRISLMNFLGDVKGKRLLFLGDNDFTSLGAASLEVADSIEVLDLDRRILNSIQRISQKEGLHISFTKSDLRQKLPKQLARRFDVVFTDPPYTTKGMNLFVSRAIQALDPDNHASRIYACYGNSDGAKERYLPVQQLFAESGLMVRWVFSRFNRYMGAESIGSASSLFITEATPQTKPLIKGVYNEQIYTNK